MRCRDAQSRVQVGHKVQERLHAGPVLRHGCGGIEDDLCDRWHQGRPGLLPALGAPAPQPERRHTSLTWTDTNRVTLQRELEERGAGLARHRDSPDEVGVLSPGGVEGQVDDAVAGEGLLG